MLHQDQPQFIFFKPPEEDASSVLSDFLKLSSEEEEFLKQFSEAVEKGEEDVLYLMLQEQDPAMLAKLSKVNENLQRYCSHSKMDLFWKEAWRKLGNKPTPPCPVPNIQYHDMLPQPGLSCFQLYRGMLLYDYGMHQINNKLTEKLAYDRIRPLLEAIKDGSFHASYSVTLYFIERVNEAVRENQTNQITLNVIKSMLNIAKKTSKLHGTPGFLLCTRMHLCIARYYHHIKNSDLANEHYKQAFSCVCSAMALEQICEASINNAYYGKGVAASNSFNLNNCTEIKNALRENLIKTNQLTILEIDYAEQNSMLPTQQFISFYSDQMTMPDDSTSLTSDCPSTLKPSR